MSSEDLSKYVQAPNQTVKNIDRVAYVKNKPVEWRPPPPNLHVAPRSPALPAIP